jgi:hypothetical protein
MDTKSSKDASLLPWSAQDVDDEDAMMMIEKERDAANPAEQRRRVRC